MDSGRRANHRWVYKPTESVFTLSDLNTLRLSILAELVAPFVCYTVYIA